MEEEHHMVSSESDEKAWKSRSGTGKQRGDRKGAEVNENQAICFQSYLHHFITHISMFKMRRPRHMVPQLLDGSNGHTTNKRQR